MIGDVAPHVEGNGAGDTLEGGRAAPGPGQLLPHVRSFGSQRERASKFSAWLPFSRQYRCAVSYAGVQGFDGDPVVRDLTFEVMQGEIFGFIGG